MNENKLIGREIKFARIRAEISVKNIASSIGTSPAYWYKYEQGIEPITLIRTIKLAKLFDIDISSLIPKELK